VGAEQAFPLGLGPEILDDHTPFEQVGVPAIDLIDFDYPCFHKLCDDLSQVSGTSLDQVGETVRDLLPRL
jgi:glutaminyl-peptide cyclotransferase